jgi:secondary thiamine-phosphate synthase enzyme
MKTRIERIQIDTLGGVQIIDITNHVQELLTKSDLKDGLVTFFVTTIEYEPGLIADMEKALDRIAPKNGHYEHDQRWHDGNGHSHVRAAFLKPSVAIPFSNKTLMLGTWQQLVFIELDVRPRNRTIVVHLMGD